MSKNLTKPILYLITRGATTETTSRASPEFQAILLQVKAATAAEIEFIQIREKKLRARVLFELTKLAVEIAQESSTRILINDRADIAAGARAHGVHLTTQSLGAGLIRKHFGDKLLIGVSTHSTEEAMRASEERANFIVFGPVFPTGSKQQYGAAQGLQKLAEVSDKVPGFPVLALGGISQSNARQCLEAGASGVAGISVFSKPAELGSVAAAIRESAQGVS